MAARVFCCASARSKLPALRKPKFDTLFGGVAPFIQYEAQMLLRLGPVAGLQVSLSLQAVEVSFPTPFLRARSSPRDEVDSKAEEPSDAETIIPPTEDRWARPTTL